MKKICIDRKKFERCIGYGCWGVITVVLISFAAMSLIEIDSVTKTKQQHENWYNYHSCYDSILEQKTICSSYMDMKKTLSFNFFFLFILNIINLGVISWWIYRKQKAFKFQWCDD